MSRGVNRVTLVGNLGNEPDLRFSDGGKAFVNISVATSENWKDANGNKQERTEWHRVKFFGKLAEVVGKLLKKGERVYIEGALRTEKYTKDGVERFTTFVVGDEVVMLGGRGPQAAG